MVAPPRRTANKSSVIVARTIRFDGNAGGQTDIAEHGGGVRALVDFPANDDIDHLASNNRDKISNGVKPERPMTKRGKRIVARLIEIGVQW